MEWSAVAALTARDINLETQTLHARRTKNDSAEQTNVEMAPSQNCRLRRSTARGALSSRRIGIMWHHYDGGLRAAIC